MIRFIDLKGQIITDEKCFAFFDTVKYEFFGWPNEYVWSNWDEFEDCYVAHIDDINQEVFPLSRFRDLTNE